MSVQRRTFSQPQAIRPGLLAVGAIVCLALGAAIAMLTAPKGSGETYALLRLRLVNGGEAPFAFIDRQFRIGTGELADSLALDPLTGLSRELVPFFAALVSAATLGSAACPRIRGP